MSTYSRSWLVAACLFVYACSSVEKEREASHDALAPAPVAVDEVNPESKEVTVRTFQTKTGGYGYDIYMNGKLYIHQPHIPAVAGNVAFKSEDHAAIAADFVAFKIRNNIIPPSISVEELDSLGIK